MKYEEWKTVLTYFHKGCYVISFCLKPLKKYWGRWSSNIALCLDDGWLTEGSYDECMNLATKIETDIDNTGLAAKEQKYVRQPCQEIDWLGLI